MPLSKTKAATRTRSRSRSPSSSPTTTTAAHANTDAMVLSGIETSAWFPFFLLAFGSLAFFVTIVAKALPFVKAGDYRFVPVLLGGVLGMVLSPVIGHFLSTCVLAVTDSIGRALISPAAPEVEEGEDGRGIARPLVLVLAMLLGVVGWLVVEVHGLRAEAATLRKEIAYVSLRDAAAHEKSWF